ncbi:unnamed protein product [Polarella glacialis]|uniref:Uncharacterized protein n=1 Tax=Polarella glacialis TaxID=89957 RepID=A0A813LZ69_POLGL|nr:unnamed protein product [Polarella glacialis]CAE8739042.1 unnamed protein product [Polarella glacialis]
MAFATASSTRATTTNNNNSPGAPAISDWHEVPDVEANGARGFSSPLADSAGGSPGGSPGGGGGGTLKTSPRRRKPAQTKQQRDRQKKSTARSPTERFNLATDEGDNQTPKMLQVGARIQRWLPTLAAFMGQSRHCDANDLNVPLGSNPSGEAPSTPWQSVTKSMNETHTLQENKIKSLERQLCCLTSIVVAMAVVLIFGVFASLWAHGMNATSMVSLNEHMADFRSEFVTDDHFQEKVSQMTELLNQMPDLQKQHHALFSKTKQFDKFVSELKRQLSGYIMHFKEDISTQVALLKHSAQAVVNQELEQKTAYLSQAVAKLREDQSLMEGKQINFVRQQDFADFKVKVHTATQQDLTDFAKEHDLFTLNDKGGAFTSKAENALATAQQALLAVKGACFPKSRLHDCPPGSTEEDLGHWYTPDFGDPFCGAAGHHITEDAADGECRLDSSGDYKVFMKGCCRHTVDGIE